MANIGHVLITGPPGIGKTTLIKKIHKELPRPSSGFYTEEIRGSNGTRIGFDIVLLDDKTCRKPLARENSIKRGPKVGKYTVLVPEFESIAIPCLKNELSDVHQIIIIDEIGK